MFASTLFTAVLASSAVLMSQADVQPNEPGGAPGSESFNQGASCHIGWAGDSDTGSTAWKNMAIELMTGPNVPVIHLTTVALGQDGTVAGTFNYTCPEVTPNSPIYFYQFTAPGATNATYTTRFTIAGTDGSSTPATETVQPNGQAVSWGKGALADPSTAVAAPTFNSTGSTGAPNSASNPGPSASGNQGSSSSGTSTSSASTPVNSGNATGTTPPAQKSGNSAAGQPIVLSTRMWPVVATLTLSAMAFTIL
ncbi:hypothetical protein B0H17DRAFT_934928 [Mycena rosella]|uniref:Ser-Thr-rich glycosyl-phosphatidyl-inositol-anchored membrane family-domain-containing protein n=1 Tax=Mycena rosella TaxID=1033263 RepID=A0AAD7GF66_MYCRO|nr:hypothetical protein B0H17DRAFT_934928 [Mycena rosella]